MTVEAGDGLPLKGPLAHPEPPPHVGYPLAVLGTPIPRHSQVTL